jgi:hypothetical protein
MHSYAERGNEVIGASELCPRQVDSLSPCGRGAGRGGHKQAGFNNRPQVNRAICVRFIASVSRNSVTLRSRRNGACRDCFPVGERRFRPLARVVDATTGGVHRALPIQIFFRFDHKLQPIAHACLVGDGQLIAARCGHRQIELGALDVQQGAIQKPIPLRLSTHRPEAEQRLFGGDGMAFQASMVIESLNLDRSFAQQAGISVATGIKGGGCGDCYAGLRSANVVKAPATRG